MNGRRPTGEQLGAGLRSANAEALEVVDGRLAALRIELARLTDVLDAMTVDASLHESRTAQKKRNEASLRFRDPFSRPPQTVNAKRDAPPLNAAQVSHQAAQEVFPHPFGRLWSSSESQVAFAHGAPFLNGASMDARTLVNITDGIEQGCKLDHRCGWGRNPADLTRRGAPAWTTHLANARLQRPYTREEDTDVATTVQLSRSGYAPPRELWLRLAERTDGRTVAELVRRGAALEANDSVPWSTDERDQLCALVPSVGSCDALATAFNRERAESAPNTRPPYRSSRQVWKKIRSFRGCPGVDHFVDVDDGAESDAPSSAGSNAGEDAPEGHLSADEIRKVQAAFDVLGQSAVRCVAVLGLDASPAVVRSLMRKPRRQKR